MKALAWHSLIEAASSAAVAEMQDEMQEEAEECAAAKRDIVNASTDEEIDQMLRKISMLCDT